MRHKKSKIIVLAASCIVLLLWRAGALQAVMVLGAWLGALGSGFLLLRESAGVRGFTQRTLSRLKNRWRCLWI